MRPPACVTCKWGTGTTCEKPTSTASGKEVEAKLKEMMAARSQQDAKWFAPPTEQSKSTNDYTIPSTSSSEIPQNKRK
jgi:hypothetical protein